MHLFILLPCLLTDSIDTRALSGSVETTQSQKDLDDTFATEPAGSTFNAVVLPLLTDMVRFDRMVKQ
jgi:hypothetical protein